MKRNFLHKSYLLSNYKKFLFVAIICCLPLVFIAPNVNKITREGNIQFKNKKYATAEKSYRKALNINEDNSLTSFNLGDALYEQQKFDDAKTNFNLALQASKNKKEIARVNHNLGNAILKESLVINSTIKEINKEIDILNDDSNKDIITKVNDYVKSDSLSKRIELLNKQFDSLIIVSSNAFKNSLRLNSLDDDSRYNLAFCQMFIKNENEKKNKKQKENKKEPTKFAIGIKKQSDKLVSQRKYSEAYNLLSNNLKKDPTIDEFRDYINKLSDIIEINNKK
jgi:tetratricopeptide (TPR) repeat protein